MKVSFVVYLVPGVVALMLIACPAPASAFTAEDIAQLKEHGVDEETLKLLIESRADLLGIVDVPGIIRLKKSGVGNDVLRALISPPERDRRVRTYGTQLLTPLRSLTGEDLIRLKEAGIGDDLLRAVIEMQQRDLWPVLLELGIINCPGLR